MANIATKIGSTLHAYELIKANITAQKGNMAQNVQNAKKFGKEHPHALIPESISKFVNWVKFSYRERESSPDYGQVYIVYGSFLYIFARNKSKLITIYHLPVHCKEDIQKLAMSIKPNAKKKAAKRKVDIYSRPLNETKKKKKPTSKRAKNRLKAKRNASETNR